MRARQLGITLGLGTPGPFNAITDVPGVRVGHSTLNQRIDGRQVRTGVTLVQPRAPVRRACNPASPAAMCSTATATPRAWSGSAKPAC